MNQFPAGTCLCGQKERHLSRAVPPFSLTQPLKRSQLLLWEVSEETKQLGVSSRPEVDKLGHETLASYVGGQPSGYFNGSIKEGGLEF